MSVSKDSPSYPGARKVALRRARGRHGGLQVANRVREKRSLCAWAEAVSARLVVSSASSGLRTVYSLTTVEGEVPGLPSGDSFETEEQRPGEP